MTYFLVPSTDHESTTKLKEKYYFFIIFSFITTSIIKVIAAFILTKGTNYYHKALYIFYRNLLFLLEFYLIPLLVIYLIILRLTHFLYIHDSTKRNHLIYLICLQLLFTCLTAIFKLWFPLKVVLTVIIITQMILFVPFLVAFRSKSILADGKLSFCDIGFIKETKKQCLIFWTVLAPFMLFYCILVLAWSSIFLILSKHIIFIAKKEGNIYMNLFMVCGSITALLFYLVSSLVFINLARNIFFIIGLKMRSKQTSKFKNILKFVYQNLGKVSFAALTKINLLLFGRFIKETHEESFMSKTARWIINSKIGFMTKDVDLDLSYSVLNNVSLYRAFKDIKIKIENHELSKEIYNRSTMTSSLLLKNYFLMYIIGILIFFTTNLRSILMISKTFGIKKFKDLEVGIIYNVYFNVTFIVSISVLIAYTMLDSINNQIKGVFYRTKINVYNLTN